VLRRLSSENPENRWERARVEYDEGEGREQGLEVFSDESQSVLSENDSPDVPFRYSVNPYRGCAHGCAYCYARPSHEYLGFGSGTDFERRLVVKPKAAELLKQAFDRRSWTGELVVFSGNTDCYQPLEAELELTRRCLEVCVAYRNPVHIITKGTLIERDVAILQELKFRASVGVSISVTFLDAEVARAIEPYAPPPLRRLATIRKLSEAGLAVGVNVAPVIPGLSDRELIPILEAARAAGAVSATSIPLRLPGSTKEVFEKRVRRHLPLAADKILARTRELRDGRLDDPRFFSRMQGSGPYAEMLSRMFDTTVRRLGFPGFPRAPEGTFQRPGQLRQLALFE
jgi:DNA repair photolyase